MNDVLSIIRMKKQATVDEGDGITDTFGAAADGGGATHEYSRSFSPSNLQLPVDFISTQRLDRESSLEAIPQQSGSVGIRVHVHEHVHVCAYTYSILISLLVLLTIQCCFFIIIQD